MAAQRRDIAGATAATYTLATTSLADDGAVFAAVVTNASGSATSDGAILHVTSNSTPVATISAPANRTIYSAGDTIGYAGTGIDPEDGALPPSAFTWQIDFHHDTHSHPFLPRHQRQHRRCLHHPRHRGDGHQRLVSRLPDRA